MRSEFLGTVSVPDGYFGDRKTGFAVYDPETLKTWMVFPFGYGSFSVPPATSSEEARWLINHHPECRNISFI
jgi:hypothetical protein